MLLGRPGQNSCTVGMGFRSELLANGPAFGNHLCVCVCVCVCVLQSHRDTVYSYIFWRINMFLRSDLFFFRFLVKGP